MTDFIGFRSIPRLMRDCVITEKIDGTNAQVAIGEDGTIYAGSRNRWITPEDDNHGFAAWVRDHADELKALGPGRHFGEWWGCGINRNYGIKEKRWSLFRPYDPRPVCCSQVPVLYEGLFTTSAVLATLEKLAVSGSLAAPGFMNPEGIVVFHIAGNCSFKVTIGNDGHKGEKRVQ